MKFGHLNTGTMGHLVMRTHGHWDKGVIVHKNTDTYIYLKTRKLEYWCLTTLEYLDTGIH